MRKALGELLLEVTLKLPLGLPQKVGDVADDDQLVRLVGHDDLLYLDFNDSLVGLLTS